MGSEVAVSLGPLSIRWYGLIITSAVLIGYMIAYRRVRAAGEDPEHLTNILVYGLISALVGARAYYVLFSLSEYIDDPAEIIAIWHGGIAIHGALIGAFLSTYIYTRRYRLDWLKWMDLMIPSMLLGQAIGRWGNFMNQEAFGTPTDLPWGIFIDAAKRPLEFASFTHFHPTFFYESIWNLAGFALLIYLSGRQKDAPLSWPKGSLLLVYGIYYSFGRFFIEGLRTDSLWFGPLRVAQLVSLGAVVGCAVLLWRLRNKSVADDEARPPSPKKKPAAAAQNRRRGARR